MKFRTGFVSNSSSCAFIVKKRYLSLDQIDKIKNHIDYASNNFPQIENANEHETWAIEETDKQIKMYTSMDNFDMYDFLIAIGVDENRIESENY